MNNPGLLVLAAICAILGFICMGCSKELIRDGDSEQATGPQALAWILFLVAAFLIVYFFLPASLQ